MHKTQFPSPFLHCNVFTVAFSSDDGSFFIVFDINLQQGTQEIIPYLRDWCVKVAGVAQILHTSLDTKIKINP